MSRRGTSSCCRPAPAIAACPPAPTCWWSAPIPTIRGFDQKRPGQIDHARAVAAIAAVPLPLQDPVYGADGPLTTMWPSMKRRPSSLQPVCCAACLPAGGPALAQSNLYSGLGTIEIPFANGPIRADHVPEIRLKLKGAAPRRFGMDTGSTGIVVSADHYEPGSGDTNNGPGQLTYNSSGRVLHGTHHTTDVEILHNDDRPAATARVQVLRVERITCLRNARDCEPNARPRGVAFMGVGFDRAAAQGTDDHGAAQSLRQHHARRAGAASPATSSPAPASISA